MSVWKQSRGHGEAFGPLGPQTKLQAPQIEVWNIINRCSFIYIQNVKPRCKTVEPGIPLLGNLSLDWEFQQRLGKNLGNLDI